MPPARPHVVVYIATSLDGFIARPDGGLDWLEHDAGGDDYGYAAFMSSVDALLMGRSTYEMVRGFGGPWPYPVPVTVLSARWTPDDLAPPEGAAVSLDAGDPQAVLDRQAERGFRRVYLDGGDAVKRFLAADLVDELILTRVPVLLGAGISLFGALPSDRRFSLVSCAGFASGLTQSTYRRARAEGLTNQT